ncbi:MAG: IS3 family transposase, partial [Actinomycetota bacterium]|nr:IS3 family transposase [Actinomycetota bacterium]
VTVALRRRGRPANHKRVERLMREHGIVGFRPHKRRSLTKQDADAPPLPDLVGRRFDPERLDHTWAGDITYVPTDEGWLYVAAVIDLASRRLVGWSMSTSPDAQLVADALKAAVATRGRTTMEGTIFHSDRGTQYTAHAFRDLSEQLGIHQSAGRTGSCLDNAVAESFFATLKVEQVKRFRYRTRAQARTSIFAWIARYNRRRLHSTIGFMPPIEWETRHATSHPLPSPMAA